MRRLVVVLCLAGCAIGSGPNGGGGVGGGGSGRNGSGSGGGGSGSGGSPDPMAPGGGPVPGAKLDPSQATAISPAPPMGWSWFELADTQCRDGSKAGIYVRFSQSDSLLFYLEGGGACISPDWCAYNPQNVNEVLKGDGQTALTSIGGAVAGRQQPGTDGIFNLGNASNPFKDWNMVYVPYCTGDVHFGTNDNGMVPGMTAAQHFVGYRNMQKIVGRLQATYPSLKQLVLTGASAGGFGAALNFDMVATAFPKSDVVMLDDSGPPFSDMYLPACMQQKWRTLWGFANSLPADCAECKQADGGGLVHLADFLMKKYPKARAGMVSSVQDEIIRLFFAAGLNNCSNFDKSGPVIDFIFTYPADQYTAGLNELRTTYDPTGRFSTYYMSGSYHQHVWRPRFFETAAGGVTIAQWASDLLGGKVSQTGP